MIDEHPIRELRKRHELSQRDLALLLGLTSMQISQYESGALQPSKRVMKRLCPLFAIDEEGLRNDITEWSNQERAALRRKLAKAGNSQ